MSNQLFQLIKSLSGAEKRYVNLNLRTFSFDENNNQLLTDFNKIEKQTQLKTKKNDVIIAGNSTRLYYKILDALFLLHKEELYDNDVDSQLIKRAQVLFHKGFYKEGIKQLNKVIYKVFSYSYLLKIEAIELKLKAAIKFADVDYLKQEFEKDKSLLKEFSKFYFNLVEYESMWAVVKLESITSYFYGSSNELNEYYNNLLIDEKNAFSPSAKIYYNQINGFFSVKNNKLNEALTYMKRARDIYERYHDIRKNKFNDYLRVIRNLCIVYIRKGSLNEAELLLEEIEVIIANSNIQKTPAIKSDIFTLMVLLRLDIIIQNNSFKENLHLIKQFEKQLLENESYIGNDEKCTCYHYLSIAYLNDMNYKLALKNTNKAIKFSGAIRKDIQHMALISELVIHYFLGNIDLLISKITAYKRILKNNGVVFSFELELPKFLSNIVANPKEQRFFNALLKHTEQSLIAENKMVYKPYISLFYLTRNKN